MFLLRSLASAKIMPKFIDAGRDGGTAIVIESASFCTTSTLLSRVLRRPGSTQKKPIRAMPPSKKINLYTSRWNWNTNGFGNKITLTRAPFWVWKPVDFTRPRTSLPSIFLF